jgi:hypothetical protein
LRGTRKPCSTIPRESARRSGGPRGARAPQGV